MNGIAFEYVKIKSATGRSFWAQVLPDLAESKALVIDPSHSHYNQVIAFRPDWVEKMVIRSVDELHGLGTALGSPYIPAAESCTILDTIVPDSMDYETHISIRKIREAIGGSLTEFVRTKLQYTQEELCKSLAAEQIDAVAMAIYNIEYRSQGMIVGDQTGIGKGRVAAAMIRYGHFAGYTPIFMSQHPMLFSDIYRDLVDVGSADLVPFIINGKEKKTDIKDINGNIVFQALPPTEQQKIFHDLKIPPGYDYVVTTYSQFNAASVATDNKPRDAKKIKRDVKPDFLKAISQGNILIMDEAHNASGSSNTGEFMQGVLSSCKGVIFLSATFAKRPDNMPIYAAKTAMIECNMDKESLVEAIKTGGVALQEVLSAQLVGEGQMIRRERSFDGVEINYNVLTDQAEEHRAVSDNITEIIRDIIAFQEAYITQAVANLDKVVAAEGKTMEDRGGTKKAGIDNADYFSKIANVISQLLFSVKADAVAEKAIERLKEGKKPIIAFANTMGAFLQGMKNDRGEMVGDGDVIDGDFSNVLLRGLEGVMRYTEHTPYGKSLYKDFKLEELPAAGQTAYAAIQEKIHLASTGITVSPIDRVIELIEKAGYSVGEVTGRTMQIQFSETAIAAAREKQAEKPKKQPPASDFNPEDPKFQSKGAMTLDRIKAEYPLCSKMIPMFQQKAIVGSEEHDNILKRLENTFRALPKNADALTHKMMSALKIKDYISDTGLVFLHYFHGGSDWWIQDYDPQDGIYYGYACLNGDWQDAEYGSASKQELEENRVELDFYFAPRTMYEVLRDKNQQEKVSEIEGLLPLIKGFYQDYIDSKSLPKSEANLNSLGKIARSTVGVVVSRKKLLAGDAFRMFNNNELDCLMVNQSGSTGVSAHAIATDTVPPDKVKQRVMIILQPELNINTEVQKRGRINRTGQIFKPIYDYVTSAIPAESRSMMVLRKKLKSLDANTTSNQRQTSDAQTNVEDFLNKIGDKIVFEYIKSDKDLNKRLGDPLKIEDEDSDDKESRDIVAGFANKVTGRIAVLPCDEQTKIYGEIMARYADQIAYLRASGEYDLEVETMNLEAKTTDSRVLIAGKGGTSVFGTDTVIETCECNVLRKPFTVDELENLIKVSLGDKTAEQSKEEIRETYKAFHENRLGEDIEEIRKDYEHKIENIVTEKKYLALSAQPAAQLEFLRKRTEEFYIARELKIQLETEKAKNMFETMDSFFESFEIGAGIRYPFTSFDMGSIIVPGIFLGWKIDPTRANPYAPSAIKARIALSDSHKMMELVCSGEQGDKLRAIKGETANYWNASRYRSNWAELIKKGSVNRKNRYIITGNILQGSARYKGNLISFTDSDGGVRKGLLMPESWQPTDKRGRAQVTLPIIKVLSIIKEMSSYKNISTTNGIMFERLWDDRFKMICPKGRGFQNFFKDTDLMALCTTPRDGFQMVSNKMVAVFEPRNIVTVIELLQKKYSLSVTLDPNEWDIETTTGNENKTKNASTTQAESEFHVEREAFELRKATDKIKTDERKAEKQEAAATAPASVPAVDEAAVKAKAKAIAIAKLRLLKLKRERELLNTR